jgi:H+-transporting ATPase
MRTVLTISTVLGLIGVVAAFGLFYLGERVFHLDRAHIQTLMYLKLSVAGHLTIFLTRTRGPFWSIRPAPILWIAVLSTQALATLVAVYGAYIMTPLGWGWALFVWGYALAWFLFNDGLKLLAYRYIDATRKATPKRQDEATAEAAKVDVGKPEAKSGLRTDAKPGEAKPELEPDRQTEGANLLAMKFGDLLLAGMASDQKGAGQFIAKAITKIEAAPGSTAPGPIAESPPASELRLVPKADATTTDAEPKPGADWQTESANVLDMKLGDVLLAGIASDPEGAGRFIAKEITGIEAAHGSTAPGAIAGSPSASEPQPAPKADATTTDAEPKPGAHGQTESANALDMKLGDVLLAGIASDPDGAGRFIAKEITEIEAAPGSTAPGPTAESPPTAAAKQDAEPKFPPATTPEAAK